MKRLSQAAKAARQVRADLAGRNGKTLVSMEAGLLGGTIEPLMPANLTFQNVFRSFWRNKKGAEQFKLVRTVAESSEFFSSMIYLKEIFFNDRFSFGEANNKKTAKWLKEQGYDFNRVVNDTWREWLTCDNVVAFWVEQDEGLPIVTILDCELCDYKNAFGAETLKLKIPQVTLKSEELAQLKARGLPERYIDAIKNGRELTLDPDQGEHFRVLTRAKLGKGLDKPRVDSVLLALSTMELFGIGDWAAAEQMKKVMRQISSGHSITNGPLAGQAMHFLKTKTANQIKAQLKGKDGAFDMVTNFDILVKYPFLDPKYFDAAKMKGTIERLQRWAGPLAMMLGNPQMIPNLIDLFETEGRSQRDRVSKFLGSIFSDETFLGKVKLTSGAELVPQWNPHTFTTQKMLNEIVRLGYSNGLISPQSARGMLEMDNDVEGDLMEEAATKPKRYRPMFEAKQGLVAGANKGGRPQDNPATPPGEAA